MLTHLEMSLPSKRTVASDGALPTCSGLEDTAGVMTVGEGRERSWSSQLGSGCAKATVATKVWTAAAAKSVRTFAPGECALSFIEWIIAIEVRWILKSCST